MQLILQAFLFIGIASALPSREEQLMTWEEQIEEKEWQLWKDTHAMYFNDETIDRVRKAIWQDNKRYIDEHNADKTQPFTLKMNHFGHLTNAEYREMQKARVATKNVHSSQATTGINIRDAPAKMDWRTEGYVTAVKNQGQCGSCWAFSTTGSIEGQYFKKTGKLVPLSEQQLVDCSKQYGNEGCQGGLMDQAFDYIKKYGIEAEIDYPYKARNGWWCHYNQAKVVTKIANYTDIPMGNEDALTASVAAIGPVSVAIDASHQSFQFYHKGVYNEQKCKNKEKNLDHGVLVVGYGTDEQGGDYYIVKNSWGAQWGKEGYVWMSRNKNNQCGIATSASYPSL